MVNQYHGKSHTRPLKWHLRMCIIRGNVHIILKKIWYKTVCIYSVMTLTSIAYKYRKKLQENSEIVVISFASLHYSVFSKFPIVNIYSIFNSKIKVYTLYKGQKKTVKKKPSLGKLSMVRLVYILNLSYFHWTCGAYNHLTNPEE